MSPLRANYFTVEMQTINPLSKTNGFVMSSTKKPTCSYEVVEVVGDKSDNLGAVMVCSHIRLFFFPPKDIDSSKTSSNSLNSCMRLWWMCF